LSPLSFFSAIAAIPEQFGKSKHKTSNDRQKESDTFYNFADPAPDTRVKLLVSRKTGQIMARHGGAVNARGAVQTSKTGGPASVMVVAAQKSANSTFLLTMMSFNCHKNWRNLKRLCRFFLLISMSFGVVSDSLWGATGFASKPRTTNEQGQATGIRAICAEAGDELCLSKVAILQMILVMHP
jgi:hypothetical protein